MTTVGQVSCGHIKKIQIQSELQLKIHTSCTRILSTHKLPDIDSSFCYPVSLFYGLHIRVAAKVLPLSSFDHPHAAA